jgi:hypothetical protein
MLTLPNQPTLPLELEPQSFIRPGLQCKNSAKSFLSKPFLYFVIILLAILAARFALPTVVIAGHVSGIAVLQLMHRVVSIIVSSGTC